MSKVRRLTDSVHIKSIQHRWYSFPFVGLKPWSPSPNKRQLTLYISLIRPLQLMHPPSLPVLFAWLRRTSTIASGRITPYLHSIMSDYGAVSSDSLDSGAVTSAVFRNLLPFVASNSSSAQIEKGDTYCREARKLLEEHYHKFPELSKKEIMDYTRRSVNRLRFGPFVLALTGCTVGSVDEAKKRVDKSSWFVQKQASQYADLAQGLYRAVDVCTFLRSSCPAFTHETSQPGRRPKPRSRGPT